MHITNRLNSKDNRRNSGRAENDKGCRTVWPRTGQREGVYDAEAEGAGIHVDKMQNEKIKMQNGRLKVKNEKIGDENAK